MLIEEENQQLARNSSGVDFFTILKKVLVMQMLGLYFTGLHEKGLVN